MSIIILMYIDAWQSFIMSCYMFFLENSKKKSEKIWLFQEKAVPLHSLLRDTLNK